MKPKELTMQELLNAIQEWSEAERALRALPETAYLKNIHPLCEALNRKRDAEFRLHEISVAAQCEYPVGEIKE